MANTTLIKRISNTEVPENMKFPAAPMYAVKPSVEVEFYTDQYVLTNDDLEEDLRVDDFLEIPKYGPAVLSNEDLIRDTEEISKFLKPISRAKWQPSRYVENQVNPRANVVEVNSHLRNYWKPNGYTVKIKREQKAEKPKSNLFRKICAALF